MPRQRARRRRGSLVVLATAMIAAGLLVSVTASGADAHPTPRPPKPTVVLVHGAWADSSSWDGVVQRLQSDGFTVDVFPTPLRGLSSDSGYLREYLSYANT